MAAPTASEQTVMASAIRVTGFRQAAFDRRRMADMRAPTWLIPMKKTKFEM